MSRDYHKICQSIQASNDKIYAGEHHILSELQSIRSELKFISKKLDKVLDMVIRIIKESN